MTRTSLLVGVALACACAHTNPVETTAYTPRTPDRPGDIPTEVMPPTPMPSATETGQLSERDRQFVDAAAQGGMFEVETSRLIVSKDVTGPDRDFAELMIKDHDVSNQALTALVREKGGQMPMMLDAAHQEKFETLRNMDGAELARAYHDMQLKAHDEAIALFEQAERDVDDADLRAFITQTLPTLRMHREHLLMPGTSSAPATRGAR